MKAFHICVQWVYKDLECYDNVIHHINMVWIKWIATTIVRAEHEDFKWRGRNQNIQNKSIEILASKTIVGVGVTLPIRHKNLYAFF